MCVHSHSLSHPHTVAFLAIKTHKKNVVVFHKSCIIYKFSRGASIGPRMVLGFFGRVLGYFITLPSRNVNGSVASKANLRRLKILSGFGDLIYVICAYT